jgi:hypothetical protein
VSPNVSPSPSLPLCLLLCLPRRLSHCVSLAASLCLTHLRGGCGGCRCRHRRRRGRRRRLQHNARVQLEVLGREGVQRAQRRLHLRPRDAQLRRRGTTREAFQSGFNGSLRFNGIAVAQQARGTRTSDAACGSAAAAVCRSVRTRRTSQRSCVLGIQQGIQQGFNRLLQARGTRTSDAACGSAAAAVCRSVRTRRTSQRSTAGAACRQRRTSAASPPASRAHTAAWGHASVKRGLQHAAPQARTATPLSFEEPSWKPTETPV